MNKNFLLTIIAVLVLAVILFVLRFNSDKDNEISEMMESNIPKETAMVEESQGSDSFDQPQGSARATRESWSIPYSEDALADVIAEGKTPVIFFHANWCPYCIATAKDLEKNISEIPEEVVILKADYDTESALKQKYNIVYQDTFVQLDSSAQEVTKWNSGGDGLESLLENLK